MHQSHMGIVGFGEFHVLFSDNVLSIFVNCDFVLGTRALMTGADDAARVRR